MLMIEKSVMLGHPQAEILRRAFLFLFGEGRGCWALVIVWWMCGRCFLKGSVIMDMDMSIAALSVGMHAQQTMQDMGTSVLKMAMDSQTDGVQELLAGTVGSLDPNLGANLDIQA